jgi:hypothetical protein
MQAEYRRLTAFHQNGLAGLAYSGTEPNSAPDIKHVRDLGRFSQAADFRSANARRSGWHMTCSLMPNSNNKNRELKCPFRGKKFQQQRSHHLRLCLP